ncbi:GNAT family N-acetyltransferase [Microbacterium bovistercoris]|uniref:GNAT family N-acetyltransferase n=1 Tax=Microbacterium bovistercoris TaxID=2293570 RepID=A0A371NSB9_9MICO|nr:GNAT family N-acetyltransferase [Microbacterium bovistercoris]REJ04515.1 GNAT family N-acetyltransferase [Microbacterium bovistercoris]
MAAEGTTAYRARLLSTDTWDDFAALVKENNGVWGGCWCMGFHTEGLDEHSAEANRANKLEHVRRGTVHQVLVYDGDRCAGWCQFGRPDEVARILNQKKYESGLIDLPDWRIGCIFTGKGHRRAGVARAAVAGALAAIEEAGGGTVEAYPEQDAERAPQRGAYFHTGPESLFEGFGFVRDRRIAKWRWVMRADVP